MKVYLSNYRHHWFSPYTLIDYFFFWTKWSKCHRDQSLAQIILPLLRQLHDKNHGAPFVDDEDVPNHTYKCDYEGMRAVEARIQNGFRLFGRYYQNLWD
jgi:hypothetical protein